MIEIVSTYRLQFHKGFTFRDAAAVVPYLHDLGITHVYASPYLKAVAGSTHGYDVIDHSQLNPEIGNAEEFLQFTKALSDHGMSHILDIVPNHMGVDTNENFWWNDVLTHGQASQYANYFDIDWGDFVARPELGGKVLLAVLAEPYEQSVSKGIVKLDQIDGNPVIGYHGRIIPIDPATDMSGDLNDMIERQHYRLAYWKVAADEINYRRFFDISGLAALRIERQDVFDAAHGLIFSLIADGTVAGVRVDHPDGLLDPKGYFERLQTQFRTCCPRQAAEGKPLFVSVEKILNGDETLREDWPVAGTSGYDFLCAVNDLFVDAGNGPAMTEIYHAFVGEPTTYCDWVYREKCAVLDTAMYSEMMSLTRRLDTLAQSALSSRDFTRRQLHEALRAVIGCFPVYRSYVCREGASESDVEVMDRAVAQAADRNPKIDSSLLDFIRDSVLLRYAVPEPARGRQLEFAQRFQQLTSPVNAKGIEDSTFYIYNRLTSLNEVGGDPGRFGRSCEAIHHYFSHRQSRWPLSLSALSTHDTKRSEDVRSRINVISEIPEEWSARLSAWRDVNAERMRGVHPNDQYLLYQTLIGAWPADVMDDAGRRSFIDRISAYMRKAVREAKLRSSWVTPDVKYEDLMTGVVGSLIDPRQSSAFLAEFLPFQARVARLGVHNSISQTVIRLTAPGICDTYQGSELWDFSLVDPDNRRLVDYSVRREMLSDGRPNPDILDPRTKLRVVSRLLRLRRDDPGLFLRGSYRPLVSSGELAGHLFAYARELEGNWVVVIVPRLLASIVGDEGWNSDAWAKTFIRLPEAMAGLALQNIMTGVRIDGIGSNELRCSDAFGDFPVAVWVVENAEQTRQLSGRV